MNAGWLKAVNAPAFTDDDAARFHAAGWWSDSTLSDAVRRHAAESPERLAYVDHRADHRVDHRADHPADSPGLTLTWRDLDSAADALASQLTGRGVGSGDRVAVWHRDSAAIHVLFVAIERCGAIVVGIGARAGTREVAAILCSAQPTTLVSDQHRRSAAAQAVADLAGDLTVTTLVLGGQDEPLSLDGPPSHCPPALEGTPRLGPDDVFLINSTSGTTGLPKCVVHTQNRWHYFSLKAIANGLLVADDDFLPVIPTPFGFGLWTSHSTPIHLGATAVITERFSAAATCEAIERHGVSVLCCVSTQLTMLTADPASRRHDLSSLRVVFTGGEALPYRPAADFEDLTGATILQFYGSNETGILSATTLGDPRERRLRTAGRVVPDMEVRLFEGDRDVTATGRGQPACRGPATSLGYLGGTDHDALFTRDGWMRMGDICEIDADGYLTVTGRTSDFILRGGKNISATEVEDAVMTHSAVAVAAAVAMPDPVFGERVCLYAELVDGAAIDLPGLVEHLLAMGFSKELLPERLIVVDELPRSSGSKVAKGGLREDIRRRMEAHDECS